MGDASLLARAFENVISNALQYTEEGGLIRISANRSAAWLEISVDDDGRGIGAGEAERIFEPFYRGSSAREGEGFGLGLYIARSIFRGHGWELRYAPPEGGSRDGRGCRFVVSMPIP